MKASQYFMYRNYERDHQPSVMQWELFMFHLATTNTVRQKVEKENVSRLTFLLQLSLFGVKLFWKFK